LNPQKSSETKAVVLVVDDDERNRFLAEAVLDSAGYAVTLAPSGSDALASFAREAPDLVLLDVMMPIMDGYETCKRLRELPGGENVPIVFLTANSDLSAHQKALDSGADDFLTKPLNRTELLIRVKSLIRIRALQRELVKNYDVIRDQRDALVNAERQKQELTDLIVHDLKSPLAGILTNVEFAIGSPSVTRDVWDALHDVSACAQTMLRMVLNLLDISRSEDGKLVPKMGDVDVPALLEQVRGATQRRADMENRKLEVRELDASFHIKGDFDLLRRVLENLVDNCLKYTPRGTTVVLDAEMIEGRVRLSVKDQGAGVPVDQRERIFEKYAQIDSGVRLAARSSRGLGLVFCKLSAEAHGGRIWVEENTPKGSVFVVEIPA
jgi:two-component system sensor histidine kinase/response regulator